MSFVYEWFRYERLMIGARCLGAAERLVDETQAFAPSAASAASSSPTSSWCRACSPTA